MRVFCTKCGSQQQGHEKVCIACGERFGGQLSTLALGGSLALALPLLLLLSDQPLANWDLLKLVAWYELPVIVGTAFLFDFHPRRRAVYFWGGAAAIVASLFALYGR